MKSCGFTIEEYGSYALGLVEDDVSKLIREHIVDGCEGCLGRVSDAYKFWYMFAQLTEHIQAIDFPEPSICLRGKVAGIGKHIPITRKVSIASLQFQRGWMRIAAGILLFSTAAGVAWDVSRRQTAGELARASILAHQQTEAIKKLESEQIAMRNLLEAARNAPVVYPGRDSIVSVRDPSLVRELQKAKQTSESIAAALSEERIKSADLNRRLTSSADKLATLMRKADEEERQYRKVFEAANLENGTAGASVTGELATYKTRVQKLQSDLAHYQKLLSQSHHFQDLSRIISLLQPGNLMLVQLQSTDARLTAYATAMIADESRMALAASGLPDPPSGRAYQVWLIRDRSPNVVSVGILEQGSFDGKTVLQVNKELLKGVKSIAVTEEPAGGSPQPTGSKVLIGNVKG